MTQSINRSRPNREYPVEEVEGEYGAFFRKSGAVFQSAMAHLPGGNSRTSAYYTPFPLYIDRAKGHYIREIGGHELLDFSLNYGTTILGHQAPAIRQAVEGAMQTGVSHCAPVEAEQQLAAIIRQRLPSIDLIRFTSSGTEAATMAIRAARVYTGREMVLKLAGGYHGSSLAGRTAIPTERGRLEKGSGIVTLPHDDPARLSDFFTEYGPELAAVICEPVLGAGGLIPLSREILHVIEKQSRKQGCLFILDEVMMFRLGYHGAQGLLDIRPDLTILGKMIGGGFPVGAFGGRRDIMQLFNQQRKDTLSHAGTYNGNTVTMMAGIACLNSLDRDAFLHLKTLTSYLVRESNGLFIKWDIPARMQKCESFFALHCLPDVAKSHEQWQQQDKRLFKCLFLGLLRAGVMLTPSGLGSTAMTMQRQDMDRALAALESTLHKYLG